MSLDFYLYEVPTEPSAVFRANITHNLVPMAIECGLYLPLWRPDKIFVTKAEHMIGPLSIGIERLTSDPDRYKAFNPDNGWGSYENLLEVARATLDACRQHPNADIEVSR